MKNNNLTRNQEKVFKLISDYFDKNGQSPTIPELRKMLNVSSLRTVTQYLEILERKGYIYRDKYTKRGVKPIGRKAYFNSEIIKVPVLGSAGCDNQTVFAEPINNEYISVSKKMLENRKGELVGIKAIGRSMLDMGINDGDIVLVEKTEQIKNNDTVVVIIDDLAVIKRINFGENSIILNPASKEAEYKPIVLNKDFKIFGKVVDIIKKPDTNDEIELIPIKDY